LTEAELSQRYFGSIALFSISPSIVPCFGFGTGFKRGSFSGWFCGNGIWRSNSPAGCPVLVGVEQSAMQRPPTSPGAVAHKVPIAQSLWLRQACRFSVALMQAEHSRGAPPLLLVALTQVVPAAQIFSQRLPEAHRCPNPQWTLLTHVTQRLSPT
jgi:hypothetical protein